MFLTIYYIAATFLQSWRLKRICNKITEKLAEKSSVVFYNVPAEGNDGLLATSELCINRSQARISDILWLNANQRGCSLVPVQTLHLGPWVTFPEPPNLIPFEHTYCAHPQLEENPDKVYLLLETGIIPSEDCDDDNVLMIEQYGKPLAWKVDSQFAILLESDINHFTKLVMSTFMQDRFSINDRLPLIRIESIQYEGSPQPFEMLKNHLRKQLTSRAMRHLSMVEWEKHLSALRSLSIFANQATEFEYNKNRTEGKTGIVKPDLIPSKNVEETDTQKISPVKKVNLKQSPVKIEAKVSPMRQVEQKHIPPVIEPPVKLSQQSDTDLNQKNTIKSPSKSTSKSPTKDKTSQECSEASKPKIKPTEDIVKSSQQNQPSESSHKPKPSPITTKTEPLTKIEPISASKDNAKRPNLVRSKGSLTACKPPNILVYSESISVRDSVITTLRDILEQDTYTVYPLTTQQVQQKIWMDNTILLIICGSVEHDVGQCLLDYFLRGGKMLSLCSDVLHIVVPTYRTAEVREHELVQFSYDKWQKVKMMHHIFCYQPSPVKKHFSNEGEELVPPPLSKKPALVCPRSIEMKDLQGDLHNLDVKVLGTEETWNTPSILLASNVKSGGKAVFSQVHLEADPTLFESDEAKFVILKQNDKARLEILCDILGKYLEVAVIKTTQKNQLKPSYKNAYFLGRHEYKFELLEKLKSKIESDNTIKTDNIALKFCGKNETVPTATCEFLPILIHSCPEDFSTVDYFDNLRSKMVGRLVIYTPIITSSMHIINGLTLTHGITVIPRHQTNGNGRNNNQWLSPEGCAMFSLQLHIPLDTTLGQRIPLMQHLVAVSIVHAILSLDGYESLDLRLKWPNDIYANGISKIGGIIINTQINQTTALCNIGCAINLSNTNPTICVNDLIKEYNKNYNKNLQPLGYEKVLAIIFTEIENLIDRVQTGDITHLYELYYRYWLHGHQDVTIIDKKGIQKQAKIIGIDEFGYLEVQTQSGRAESVHPDGNSFDMLRGLILPK